MMAGYPRTLRAMTRRGRLAMVASLVLFVAVVFC